MKKYITALAVCWSIFGLMSCQPEKGDVGPQGPPGVAGAQGDPGAAGDRGAFTGYASPWTEVGNNDWYEDPGDPDFLVWRSFEEQRITSDVLKNGLVLVYYTRMPESNNFKAIYQLPDVTPEATIDFSAHRDNGKGFINVFAKFKDKESADFYNLHIKVRWLIIPPATNARMAHIDWSNYEEVKKEFGLID